MVEVEVSAPGRPVGVPAAESYFRFLLVGAVADLTTTLAAARGRARSTRHSREAFSPLSCRIRCARKESGLQPHHSDKVEL